MVTGKEQRITITSSTKLSDEEIQAKVKEAEQYAEEDKKRKEEVEIRNHAEGLIYETEKSLKELEGKISEEEKNQITAAKDELQAVLNNGTVDQIKEKTEALTEKFHIISTKLYQQAAQNQQAQGGAQGFDPNMGGAGFNPNMGGQGFDSNNFTGSQQAGPANDDNVVDADYTVVDEDK
jgi:molecular chaperone DnaK